MIERISHFSYGLIGRTAEELVPHLRDLELKLKRAGIRVSLQAYISFMLFMSLLAFILSLVSVFMAAFLFFRLTIISSLLVGVTVGLLAFALAFAMTYSLPSTMAGRRRKEIEVNLPFTLSYMSILASAGLPPNRIFRALAVLEERGQLGLAGEAKNILRDVEVFGVDLATALKEAARRSPSPSLSGIFEGMISTIHAGGDLSKYFEEEARELMGIRRITLREFVDVLLMLAEVYMAIFVAFPLILIVLLVILSFLGGGTVAGITPENMIQLMVYGMIPVFGVIFLVMISLMTPKA